MPEELNRIVTDHISDLLLTPSEAAKTRLLEEGIPSARIVVVGDVMYDAVLLHLGSSERSSTIIERLDLSPKGYVLCTIHRAENTDDPMRLENLIQALVKVADHLPVVFPVHPRSRKVLQSSGMAVQREGRLLLIDPVGYLDMIALERHAAVVATDSGGVQKEAFFLEVPCVTLRDQSEWTELFATGWNRLAPPDGSTDVAGTILSSIGRTGQLGVQPYGDGKAAFKVCAAVQGLVAAKANHTETV
jgi:UDP-GlcNAc3NAcA epimerase